jgi:putative tryptophan/tyrosine transport system ATP-binding protein
MIRLEKITKTFNRHTPNEHLVFDRFDLIISKGDFLVVVGSNGSGKSTLLNLLSGTTLPDDGNIFLDEKNITSLREYERSKYVSRVFQNPLTGTAPDLTILENFRLASIRTGKKKMIIGTNDNFRKKIREKIALLQLGLEDRIDQPVATLSGGQRQALTLVMATLDETKILLLDEPAAALDPATSKLVMELSQSIIRQLALTAILVTHHMPDVIRYGNRVVHLDRGKIVHDLDVNLKAKLQVQDVFNWFGQ